MGLDGNECPGNHDADDDKKDGDDANDQNGDDEYNGWYEWDENGDEFWTDGNVAEYTNGYGFINQMYAFYSKGKSKGKGQFKGYGKGKGFPKCKGKSKGGNKGGHKGNGNGKNNGFANAATGTEGCWTCGEAGHYSRECPHNPKGKGKNGYGGGKANANAVLQQPNPVGGNGAYNNGANGIAPIAPVGPPVGHDNTGWGPQFAPFIGALTCNEPLDKCSRANYTHVQNQPMSKFHVMDGDGYQCVIRKKVNDIEMEIVRRTQVNNIPGLCTDDVFEDVRTERLIKLNQHQRKTPNPNQQCKLKAQTPLPKPPTKYTTTKILPCDFDVAERDCREPANGIANISFRDSPRPHVRSCSAKGFQGACEARTEQNQ